MLCQYVCYSYRVTTLATTVAATTTTALLATSRRNNGAQLRHGRKFLTTTIKASNNNDHRHHHITCGYLAGYHSHEDNNADVGTSTSNSTSNKNDDDKNDPYSFESAWETIQSVPVSLLDDFEDELWTTQSKKFIYGSKRITVLDAIIRNDNDQNHEHSHDHDDQQQQSKIQNDNEQMNTNNPNDNSTGGTTTNSVVRYLILNERPHLIQTAIEVPDIDAAVATTDHHHRPSPLSQTHLGGLAMVVPVWYQYNNKHNNNNNRYNNNDTNSPNCLIIGAGGCSLARTLAHKLASKIVMENTSNSNTTDTLSSLSSSSLTSVTAIDSCSEILHVARLWFGAPKSLSSLYDGDDDDGRLPLFNLVHDTGESYLESLVHVVDDNDDDDNDDDDTKNNNNNNNNCINTKLLDVLIIDAEDGTGAPPKSMKTQQFWNESVRPALNNIITSTGKSTSMTNGNGNGINIHDDVVVSGSSNVVIGVNFIGNQEELEELLETIRSVFTATATIEDNSNHNDNADNTTDNCSIQVLSPPPEIATNVCRERHKLIFIVMPKREMKKKGENQYYTTGNRNNNMMSLLTTDDLIGYVDQPQAWGKQIRETPMDDQ